MTRKNLTIHSDGQSLLETDLNQIEETEAEWIQRGIKLGKIERMVQWEIGDWWNRGENYGNRVAIVSNPEWEGPNYQTCRNYARVAARFEVYRRQYTLSFTHHAELVSEAPEAADEKLQQLVAQKVETGEVQSTRHLRQAVKRTRREQREHDQADATAQASRRLNVRQYGVILADPPWRFDVYSEETGMDRSADNHYGTMSTEDICALKVPASDNSVLFLWRTAPMLEHALAVMLSWGFSYKTEIVWGKDRIGLGLWNRNKHEVLMIGTRGKPVGPAAHQRPDSLILADVGRHSEKPTIFHEIIETMYPNAAKLEMFARQFRTGWDVFGNELPTEEAA